jgi:AcrR family transcriptional regulator
MPRSPSWAGTPAPLQSFLNNFCDRRADWPSALTSDLTDARPRANVNAVNLVERVNHKPARSYHHGDLRTALVEAALMAIEDGSYEDISMRDLAGSLGVSEAAPYRHFKDKRALLATLAAHGFRELEARAKSAMSKATDPASRMLEGARAYLAFAARRPQLFRLMFVSDLLTGREPRDQSLVAVANSFHHQFESIVAGICTTQDDKSVKASSLAIWSLLHGFAQLRMGSRLMPFMLGSLTDSDLVEAILAVAIAAPMSVAFRSRERRRHPRRPDKVRAKRP